jgi:peptide deformylase
MTLSYQCPHCNRAAFHLREKPKEHEEIDLHKIFFRDGLEPLQPICQWCGCHIGKPILERCKDMNMILSDMEILREISQPVAKGEDTKKIVEALKAAMFSFTMPGVGISAIQIGIPQRICLVRLWHDALKQWTLTVITNPEIIYPKEGSPTDLMIVKEGCLSFPGKYIKVRRHAFIHVKCDEFELLKLQGFRAQVLQHEIDHMNGIIFTDREYVELNIGRNDPCPCGSKKKFKKCCALKIKEVI